MEDRTCIYCDSVLADVRAKVCADHRLYHRRVLHQRRLGREWSPPVCVDCGETLADAPVSAQRCEVCRKRLAAQKQRERKSLIAGPKPPRTCRNCGEVISADRRRDAITCGKRCIEAWRSRNVDRSAYMDSSRDRRREATRAWRLANPARARALVHRRRSLLKSGVVSDRDWEALVRRYDGRCAYCGSRGPMTMDHVVPVSRGGSNFIGNILPACKPCNSSKGARLLVEWRVRKLALAA